MLPTGVMYQVPSPCSWVSFWILDDNVAYDTAVRMWETRIQLFQATPAKGETWGKIKAMYKQ